MRYYVVNAFTDAPFGGNPAGVCLLDRLIDDALMQNIAAQNNLAETAFVLPCEDGYRLRWFTPKTEIDLCGHATLAAAFVIMRYTDTPVRQVRFHTKSGTLSVEENESLFMMDFPARAPAPCAGPALLEKALGAKVAQTLLARDLVAVLHNEDAVARLHPDLQLLSQIEHGFGLIVTAKGDSCDFVSRFFAPNAGIPEDPVTGSAHCTLVPYWSDRLGKTKLYARQLSARGGEIYCENRGQRVRISGRAVCYSAGEILIERN